MRMRHHVEYCLRNLVSERRFDGRFSREMEQYWHDVGISYKRCGFSDGVPQTDIPLWWARARDLKIPVEHKDEPVVQKVATSEPEDLKIDMRTREGRALKEQLVPAGA